MSDDTRLAELTERLTDMEMRYAHQSRLLDELNEVLTESNRRIDRLEKENRRLRETVERLAPVLIESPDE